MAYVVNMDYVNARCHPKPLEARLATLCARGPRSASKQGQGIVNLLIEKGALIRRTQCEKCNRTGLPISAHHVDYLYPLRLEWLCRSCHKTWHNRNGSAPNRDAVVVFTVEQVFSWLALLE